MIPHIVLRDAEYSGEFQQLLCELILHPEQTINAGQNKEMGICALEGYANRAFSCVHPSV
jgi:hypothetical protein